MVEHQEQEQQGKDLLVVAVDMAHQVVLAVVEVLVQLVAIGQECEMVALEVLV
jgi:hypothetical protein